MEQIKRQRTNSVHNYDNNKKQKIQAETNRCLSKECVTCFEDLSNELIYEIFELLDFHYVYNAFYSLNTRFHNLIVNSTLPIEVNLSSISKSTFQRFNKDIILPNKHRIHSLHLSNLCLYDDISSPIHIISEFLHLETLSLNNIELKYLEYLLGTLVSLPCLSSLSIVSADFILNKTPIYYQVVRLPALKYCSLSLKGLSYNELFSPTIDEYSPIEYLTISHDIPIDQLYNLLSYVPKLRRLCVYCVIESSSKYIKTSLPVLPYLTHVSLDLSFISFNVFQQLVIDIFRLIQILHIFIRFNSDQMYTNANRWEQLILSHMPNLRIFDIRHEGCSDDITSDNQAISNTPTDNFSSSFWIERQWFVAQQYYEKLYKDHTIIYSTDPYRRKYYTLCNQIHQSTCLNSKETHLQSVQHLQIYDEQQTINCKYYFPNVTILTFKEGFSITHNSIVFMLNHVIPLKQLTKLIIKCDHLSLTKLIELLCWTPHIHTLVFESMSLHRVSYNSIQQNQSFQLVSSTNTITNVTFKPRCTLDKLQILVALFSRIQRLTINFHTKDLESCVRFLLEKTNRNTSHLYSLRLLWVDTIWLARLETLIVSDMFLDDYTLKMMNKDLYLWW
ncbi:unnamed protein product [Adineta steineri]|uniref:F-box domain-containing protein n=1 Tax=Adineta steineri TaxID=433720 RepID=A0A818PG41_9BILA|nr:unnamed protein product [Adineta steineri]